MASTASGDAEVKLLPDDLWLIAFFLFLIMLFSGYFWQILANPSYFLATVWLILATLGLSWLLMANPAFFWLILGISG